MQLSMLPTSHYAAAEALMVQFTELPVRNLLMRARSLMLL